MDKSEMAVRGAAGAPASEAEVRRLVLEARFAWGEQRRLGLTDDAFDAWRRGALWDAVGKASFRAVGQHEFGVALAHFERLAGRAPAGRWQRANHAIAERESGPEGDRRRAEHELRQACAELAEAYGGEEQALAYARALLARIHRTELARATPRQVWQALFTLRSRARARLRRAAEDARLAEGRLAHA